MDTRRQEKCCQRKNGKKLGKISGTCIIVFCIETI